MARSRIRTHLKEQSIHTMGLAIFGMIVIIVLFFLFGPQLLINFSLLVKKSSSDNDIAKKDLTYVAPPVLNPMSEATKSAEVIISGYARDKQTIQLYINGKKKNKTIVKKDNQFSISGVKLEKGSNEIKAKAITEDDKESAYSDILTITYSDEPPKLDISFPQNDQSLSKDNRHITVRGTTNPGVRVVVNGFWAITDDDGNFSYNLSLNDGDNYINVVATDEAGNETTKEVKVKIE